MCNTIFKHLFLFSCRGNLFPHHQKCTKGLRHFTSYAPNNNLFTGIYLFIQSFLSFEWNKRFIFLPGIENVNSCYSYARNLRNINSSCVSFSSLCSHLCPAMILLIIQNIQTLNSKQLTSSWEYGIFQGDILRPAVWHLRLIEDL